MHACMVICSILLVLSQSSLASFVIDGADWPVQESRPENMSTVELLQLIGDQRRAFRNEIVESGIATKDRDQLGSIRGSVSGLFVRGSVRGDSYESRRVGKGEVFVLNSAVASVSSQKMKKEMLALIDKHPDFPRSQCYLGFVNDLIEFSNNLAKVQKLSKDLDLLRDAVDELQSRLESGETLAESQKQVFDDYSDWAETSYIVGKEFVVTGRYSLRKGYKSGSGLYLSIPALIGDQQFTSLCESSDSYSHLWTGIKGWQDFAVFRRVTFSVY